MFRRRQRSARRARSAFRSPFLNGRKPLFELLEDRRLLASDVTLAGGVLSLTDNTDEVNIVTMDVLDLGGGNVVLQFTDTAGITPDGNEFAAPNGTTVQYLLSAITANQININTNGQDDTVSVLASPSGMTTTVDTGVGSSDATYVGVLAADVDTGTGTLANIAGSIVTKDSGGAYDLFIDNSAESGNRDWTIDSNGSDLGRVMTSGVGSIQYDTIAANTVEIVGGSGDDQFTIDFAGGNADDPLPFNQLDLRGGGQNTADSLVLQNATVNMLTHTFTSAGEGTIVIDDFAPNNDTINYSGLEPIVDNLNVANRVFTFSSTTTDGGLIQDPNNASRTRIQSSVNELVDFTTPTASLTVNLFTGNNTFSVNGLANGYNTPANTINGNTGADTVNFETSGAAASNWTVAGMAGDDIVNLSPTAKNLDNLLGPISFMGGGDTNTLNVFDTNDTTDNSYTVTSTMITRAGFGGVTYDGNVDFVNLDAGAGNDTIAVNSTSASATTTIRGNDGGDTYNIAASSLAGTNDFSGNAADDTFNVNLTVGPGISAALALHGDANDFGGGVGSRDVVVVSDLIPLGAANVTVTYTGGGPDGSETTVDGLGTQLVVDTAETLRYVGAGGNNDLVTVVGTAAGDDLITAAPISGSRALVFNNAPTDSGGPFDGPPQDFATRFPGVAGGSVRPDLDLQGLANLAGLTISDPGAGTGDRLYIYGESTAGLNDGNSFDPFGFGAGQILPAVPEPMSFDVVTVTDTQTIVDTLVAVNYNSSDFAQADPQVDPAVVINSGFEGNPPSTPGTDVADDITVTLSTNYKFQVNGGDPDPATTSIVPPNGDKLSLVGPVSPFSVVNVWATKDPGGGPPVITIDFDFAVSGLLPIGFSSIENFGPISATTVNLIGDNNDPAIDQDDTYVVTGTGHEAFELLINNATTPLSFDSVQFLNAYGDDQNPPPGTPSVGPNDIDTLEITPYADNTPQGWGIDVFFNEGNPPQTDGNKDLLIYHTAVGLGGGGSVSEDIVIQPSGPDNGELRVTNQALGTPIVVISYVANTDIVIIDDDGSLSDNDALYLNGTNPNTPQTSGRETVSVDFDAAGTPADPMVTVTDTANSMILYRVRSIMGIDTVNFNLQDGNDNLTFRTPVDTTFASGINQVNVLGGGGDDSVLVDVDSRDIWHDGRLLFDGGTGADSLMLSGTPTNAISTATYTPGTSPGSGQIIYDDGNSPNQIVDFTNLEPVVDLVVAATLIVNGTPAANQIEYRQGSTTSRGLVSIDNFETMEFANKTTLQIVAGAGDDVVVVNNAELPTSLQTLVVDGNGGNDDIRIEALPDASATTFISALINGGAGNDTIDGSQLDVPTPLTINGNAGNDTIGGGAGKDTLDAGTGDDTLIFSLGDDALAGNSGNDRLLVLGTLVADVITFEQTDPNTLNVNYNGTATTNDVRGIELVDIQSGNGDDMIGISVSDSLIMPGPPDTDLGSLAFHVDGGSPNASDRLVVRDDGVGDLVIHRQGPDGRSGSIVVGPLMPVDYEGIEFVSITPLDPVSGRTGTAFDGQLIVFRHDELESNDSRLIATPLGGAPTFLGDLNIDPGPTTLPAPFGSIPGDEDWFEFRPPKIGTFRFETLFNEIPTLPSGRQGLPDNGDLDIEVYDAFGNLIAVSNFAAADGESLDISMKADTSYYLRVMGFNTAINVYDLNIVEVDVLGPQVYDPDGAGPVNGVHITDFPEYDLFQPKPSDGPTPLIDSLTIHLRDLLTADLGPRAPGDVYPALDELVAEQLGLYSIVGDHVGNIVISSVTVHNADPVIPATVTTGTSVTQFADSNLSGSGVQVGDTVLFTSGANVGQVRTITAYNDISGSITVDTALPAIPAVNDTFEVLQIATATVELTFDSPLPDDRYTLTILDGVVDPPGNKLDGESNAATPQSPPTLPSGNGISGGNFVARFTVDARPEIGAYVAKDIDIDINGNFVWDPANAQIGGDTTNVDLSFTLPVANAGGTVGPGGFGVHDLLFAGKLVQAGANPSGFDQLAAFGYSAQGIPGSATPQFRWIIDTNSDGVVTAGTDIITTQPTNIGFDVAGAIPVAADFNPGIPGDEVGLYNHGVWALDMNHNFVIDAGEVTVFGNMLGQPIVGDFDGDGADDLAVFNNNQFFFDFNRDGFSDTMLVLGFPGVLDKPVAADMNQDGIDDIGLWTPRTSASPPRSIAEWYFWISDSAKQSDGTINALNHAFTVVPFGNDIFAEFGDERALPIVGNFDPPVRSQTSNSVSTAGAGLSGGPVASSTTASSTLAAETSSPATTPAKTAKTAASAATETASDSTNEKPTEAEHTEAIDPTPTTTAASPVASADQSPAKVATPKSAQTGTSTSVSKAAAPVASNAVVPVVQVVAAPTLTSKGKVVLQAADAASQNPTAVKSTKVANVATPAAMPAEEPASTPDVKTEVTGTAEVKPVVAPVTNEGAKQAVTKVVAPAPVKAASNGAVNLTSTIPADQKPVTAKAAKVAAVVSTPAAITPTPAPTLTAATTLTAPTVSSLVVQAPASAASVVVADVPTISFQTLRVVPASGADDLGALSASFASTEVASVEALTVTPLAPLSVSTSLDGALLLLSEQSSFSSGSTVQEAIGQLDFSASDEFLDDVSDAMADGTADGVLAIAWQDWDAV